MNADFLRRVVMVCAWRGDDVDKVSAGLLIIGLNCVTYDAGMIPGELIGESKTIAGIATGRMIAVGLIEVVGRVRSSSPHANGRKVNQLQIPLAKRGLAKSWLANRGYQDAAPTQQEMKLA